MPQASRTFRLFVSSTFSDLVAERNALQSYVFPRLRELAITHGCRFQAIDLRWGVSEEAALDQQTIRICLTEIDRCQKITPRPNFIVLLGDRYGWRPLPYAIPADEFEALLPHLSASECDLTCWRESKSVGTQGWYRRDENAVPAEYVLQPRQKGSRYEGYDTWQSEVERPLLAALERAARQAGLQGDALAKYSLSATGQEIALGTVKVEDAREHVFGFLRSIANPDEVPGKARESYLEPDPELRQRQRELKAWLRERLPRNIHEYQASWDRGGLSTAHIGSLPPTLEECLDLNSAGREPKTLCEAVWLRLSRVILAEMGRIESVAPLRQEQEAHLQFGRERTRLFLGREESLTRVAEYLSGSEPHPLVLWGQSGCGKSALMAQALQRAEKGSGQVAALMARFIGATPDSSSGRALLESLCRQIYEAFDYESEKQRRLASIEGQGEELSRQRQAIAAEYDIPTDAQHLARTFDSFLSRLPPGRQLFLFLDALDQLTGSDSGRGLAWLPRELPPQVRLVVSTLSGECLTALERRLPASSLLQVPALGKADGERLLQGWLDEAGRTLTDEQRGDIMSKFERGGGLPLYLKLAFEEALQWHAYDGLPGLSDEEPGPSGDIPGVIRDLFWRLEQDGNHGKVLVSHVLGYLAAARNGLSEDELLDVLWRDDGVRSDFFRRSPQSPHEVSALPVVIWARLYMDLEPYLAPRRADGAELMGFYHRQVAEAAQAEYLNREHHAGLAAYFAPQPLYLEGREAVPNLRKLSEMVYQQAGAGLAAQVEEALLDCPYLRAKLAGQGVQALIEDYGLVPGAGVGSDKARSLRLVQGALRLSAHVLGSDPSQLPGQLTGRLLACASREVQELLAQAIRTTAGPWLRPLCATLDAPGRALLGTLTGHTAPVSAVALTPDGRRAVSGSSDKTLKVWNLESGEELAALSGHTGYVTSVALTPDGRRAVSGSYDKTLKLWDLEGGVELATLSGHSGEIHAVAVTPDGRWVLSASSDKTLKVWDLEGARKLLTLRGHSDTVFAVAVTPDGRRAVSASDDKTLKVWDLESRAKPVTLRGHADGVLAVTLTPDGRHAVSGSRDKTLKVWDLERGVEVRSLSGHGASVWGVAVTPDGRFAVSASMYPDQTLRVWDLQSGAELACLRGHTGHVNAVAVTPDGRQAVSASDDRTLRLWDIPAAVDAGMGSGRAPAIQPRHENLVSALAVTPDGRRVVSGSDDRTLKVWDLESRAELATLRGHRERVTAVGVTPDGRRAVSGGGRWLNPVDYALRVWDLDSGTVLATLPGHSDQSPGAVVVTPDGRQAVSGASGSVKVWDLESGALLATLRGHSLWVEGVAVTPDGRRVVSAGGLRVGSNEYSLKVWDLESRAELATLSVQTRAIKAVAVAPDGRRAVSASDDHTLTVWDLQSGAALSTLRGHRGSVTCVAVTPDGRRAVSGSWDHTLKVWDLESGSEVATFTEDGILWACAVSPDGTTIVAGGNSGRVHFLRLEGVPPGPAVLTAWRESHRETRLVARQPATPRWQFWRQQPVLETAEIAVSSLAFGCPHCRTWSEAPESALNTRICCPHCGKPVRLNPFVVEADWRPLEAAWGTA